MFFAEKLGPIARRANPMALHAHVRHKFGDAGTASLDDVRRVLAQYLDGKGLEDTVDSAMDMLTRRGVISVSAPGQMRIAA